MKELVFATNNAHKLQEIRSMVGQKFRILSLADINCHDDIPETADTLEGNASSRPVTCLSVMVLTVLPTTPDWK